jgi:N-6 DNA Methylase
VFATLEERRIITRAVFRFASTKYSKLRETCPCPAARKLEWCLIQVGFQKRVLAFGLSLFDRSATQLVFKPYASIGTNLLFFEKGTPTTDIWFWEHRVPEGQKAYSMTKPIRFEHLQGCIDWWGGAKREGREETPQAWKVSADQVKARGYDLDIKNPHTVADNHGDPDELLASLNVAEAETTNLRNQLKVILAEALA